LGGICFKSVQMPASNSDRLSSFPQVCAYKMCWNRGRSYCVPELGSFFTYKVCIWWELRLYFTQQLKLSYFIEDFESADLQVLRRPYIL